jgi:hypothetical protein
LELSNKSWLLTIQFLIGRNRAKVVSVFAKARRWLSPTGDFGPASRAQPCLG